MLLAIDCGNTNTLFAVHDNGKWVAQWRASTSSVRTADEYVVWLSQLMGMKNIKPLDITGCIISTVVPQSIFHLRNLCRRYFDCVPYVVGENVKLDIQVNIDNPKEAGADRLVNAIGAFSKYGGPLIVVDSGTATTFDVIGINGDFEGGVISPGISLSLLALHNAAAKLPRIEIKQTEKVNGKNTVEAMQSGIFWGYVSLIEGIVKRLKTEIGVETKVIATGGVVSIYEGVITDIDYFDHDLTINGLLELYKRVSETEIKTETPQFYEKIEL